MRARPARHGALLAERRGDSVCLRTRVGISDADECASFAACANASTPHAAAHYRLRFYDRIVDGYGTPRAVRAVEPTTVFLQVRDVSVQTEDGEPLAEWIASDAATAIFGPDATSFRTDERGAAQPPSAPRAHWVERVGALARRGARAPALHATLRYDVARGEEVDLDLYVGARGPRRVASAATLARADARVCIEFHRTDQLASDATGCV
ncbi:hypothetical protein AB1Y20_010327 [Prymnesium parvum]|uniref:Uncharacterized protein n=1 Tax=Prymnesium parvum TaxID=97485 RepID=A0AB34K806_PRYPA